MFYQCQCCALSCALLTAVLMAKSGGAVLFCGHPEPQLLLQPSLGFCSFSHFFLLGYVICPKANAIPLDDSYYLYPASLFLLLLKVF